MLSPAKIVGVLGWFACVVAACGGSSDSAPGDDDTDAEGNDGNSASGGDDPAFGTDDGTGSGTNSDPSCAATRAPTSKGSVDIVFVIDNSGSMGDEIKQVTQNVNTFAQTIGQSGLDYRVIFISASAPKPGEFWGGSVATVCAPAPLAGANCGDNPPLFFQINELIGSHDSLRVVLSTYPQWQGHLRPESTKVFVEVTDDESKLSAESFDQQLLAKTPADMFGTAEKRQYVFHSIVSKPSGATAPSSSVCSTAAGTSLEYQKLSLLTGGIVDEVCKTDYSAVLGNLAKGINERLGCELTYPTAQAADPKKVVVSFETPGGSTKHLTQVTDASKCGLVDDGWYYDDDAKPTKILLCPTMCTTAAQTPGATIEALVGCKAPEPR